MEIEQRPGSFSTFLVLQVCISSLQKESDRQDAKESVIIRGQVGNRLALTVERAGMTEQCLLKPRGRHKLTSMQIQPNPSTKQRAFLCNCRTASISFSDISSYATIILSSNNPILTNPEFVLLNQHFINTTLVSSMPGRKKIVIGGQNTNMLYIKQVESLCGSASRPSHSQEEERQVMHRKSFFNVLKL